MLEILQENTEAIAVFKPAGLPVFPLKQNPSEDTVLRRLYHTLPAMQAHDWPAGFEGGIAHRLDIPTTGLLLVAKDSSSLQRIRSFFSEKIWEKEYFFLSAKEPRWQHHTISAPLGHDPKKKKRMTPRRGKNTKIRGKWYNAQTEFFHHHRAAGVSLWGAKMRSGVMHQIRVHAAFAGIALLGDSLYGGGARPSYFPSLFALHHYRLDSWAGAAIPSWWPGWAQAYVEEYNA